MKAIQITARLLAATIFMVSGVEVAKEPGNRAQAAAALGVPQPELAVRANAVIMLFAGAALALGIVPRGAAAVLAAALVPTTLAGHPFWKEPDPQKRQGQIAHFLKNLSMLGGLLFMAASEDSR